ncbi:MAG: tetratricopeptide repeat protein, partial [Chthoniobacterales bacterium]
MHLRKFTAVVLLVLSSFVAYGVNSTKPELVAMYDKAFSAFDQARYGDALKALDAIDVAQPDLAESLNLRGVVYMRQEKFDKAEVALRKALSLEPKFWNASFNLAEIPFLKKDWSEARNRFTALMAGGEGEGLQPETRQLIEYKIFLTFVMQGKEGTADWILNKFEGKKNSPALYYANAAVAFRHDNPKEAKDWLAAANKQFPGSLNKLYAESFYEVGWMQKPAGEARAAIEITSVTERSERLKVDAKANLEKAERAFQQRDFEAAFKSLDLAEKGAPNDAPTLNLRGEILMEQEKYAEAEVVFQKVLAVNPKFREAQYNLAQIPFKKKEYAMARDRFESLYAETPGGEKNQAAQLIKYKIFMTLLLEDKDPAAQQLMDQFKFTGDTPALYYAQAAWEFKHGRTEQGHDWVTSARKIYSPALNMVFADSFYDLSWLDKSDGETSSPTSALAQADAPAATGAATPAMRFGPAETVQAPAVAETATTPPGGEAVATGSPAAAAIASAKPVTAPIAATRKAAQPTATVASGTTSAASAVASDSVNASEAARQWSRPSFAEMVDRVSNPRSLLVLALLLAGIVLLVWLVVQQFRRNLSHVPLYNPAEPLTEPPFAGDEPTTGNERRISREHLSSSPPKVSLNLVASEPSVRAAVLPSGAITGRGSIPGVDEPMPVSPNEKGESISEIIPPIAAPVPPPAPRMAIDPPVAKEPAPAAPPEPLRDREEISMPFAPITTAPAAAEKVAEPVAEKLPVEGIAEPVAKIEEPAPKIEEPAAKIDEPVADIQEPAVKIEEVAAKIKEPAAKIEEPAAKIEEPAAEVEEPAT